MLTWSMLAPPKSRSSWATAAVLPAASVARPETSSRRLSEPFSKRAKRLEMIDSMSASFRSKRWNWPQDDRAESGRFKSAIAIALGPIWRTIATMDRRRFLFGLVGGGAALLGRASAQDGPAMARLGIDYEDAGRPIARDFVGLSYETAVVAANDFFTADNRTLLR